MIFASSAIGGHGGVGNGLLALRDALNHAGILYREKAFGMMIKERQ